MSAFRSLKSVCENFEKELQRASNELFPVTIKESFEDNVAKKLRDLSLYSSKLRLLRAKALSLTPQVSEHEHDEDTTLASYGDRIATRVIEQQLVKSVTQAQAVRALLTAPDQTLHPKMVKRKENIKAELSEYRTHEAKVQHHDTILQEKEAKLEDLRAQWDLELSLLTDMRVNNETCSPLTDVNDALYQKISTMVNKLVGMQWLVGKLGVPRSRGYDWLSDPHRLLRVIKLAREKYCVDFFLQDN